MERAFYMKYKQKIYCRYCGELVSHSDEKTDKTVTVSCSKCKKVLYDFKDNSWRLSSEVTD